MIVAVVVLGAALVAQVYVAYRLLAALTRQHAREKMAWSQERGELLNRIMYMAKMPWSGPTAEVEEERLDPYDGFAFPHEIVGATEDELVSG